MILVDSSVVIDYTRKKDPKLQTVFMAGQAAICGVVRAEVLAGARNDKHRQLIIDDLAWFQELATPEALWEVVGDNLAALYRRGFTMPLPDVVLATLAIANNIELWARDAHFPLIQSVLPQLKLFQEPP
jgi:predicted nucleic acid-binding protein